MFGEAGFELTRVVSTGTEVSIVEGMKKHMDDEASYICDACGEEIVIPIDSTAGSSQKYVEDCPVCCRASVIHVEIDEDGEARVWAEAE